MSRFAIRVEGLGKEYVIGGAEQTHDSFREMLTGALGAPFRKLRRLGGGSREEERFWALRDVTFHVREGEVLGIIGRNGAGKSTLLKVLSRITPPTTGRVVTRGRVASLLEVGTGFHPELTGRENIFLNGAILGMSRKDIECRFDQIVAFAEIDKFLDTPVKRYSSGMYIRLAFAVAAHMEPEILLVDEVLAVGDAEFQRKCLGKMGHTASEGRTVLFVSHNLNVLREVCPQSLLLDKGRLIARDDTESVIAQYLPPADPGESRPSFKAPDLTINNLKVASGKGQGKTFLRNEAISVSLEVRTSHAMERLHLGYALYTDKNRPLWWSFFGDCTGNVGLRKGTSLLRTSIPAFWLNDGDYTLEIIGAHHGVSWILPPGDRNCYTRFKVAGGSMGSVLVSSVSRPTLLFPLLPWTIETDV